MTDDEFKNAVVVLLVDSRTLLTEVRDLLMGATQDEDGGCPHPEEQRISLSAGGDLNHWVCKVCRFDNKAMPIS